MNMDSRYSSLNWNKGIPIQIFLWIYLLETVISANPGCDCILFLSTFGKPFGVFQSPDYPKPYGSHVSSSGCLLYTFQAQKNEVVELTFSSFEVGHLDQDCSQSDSVKLYQHLDKAEVSERSIPTTTLCGSVTEVKLKHYSKGPFLILELAVLDPAKSDFAQPSKSRSRIDDDSGRNKPKNVTRQLGFRGTFRFIPKASLPRTDGQKISHTTCDYQFISSAPNTKKGRFFSPLYPAPTPGNLKCRYMFYGRYQERVRILFDSLEVNEHDSSCLFSEDYIQVYDGIDNSAPVISHVCGKESYLELWSTSTHMMVEFYINSGQPAGGFAAAFQFVSPGEMVDSDEDVPEEERSSSQATSTLVTTPTTVSTLRPTRSYFPAVYSKTASSTQVPLATLALTTRRTVPTTVSTMRTATSTRTTTVATTKLRTDSATTPSTTSAKTITANTVEPRTAQEFTRGLLSKNVTQPWKLILDDQSMSDVDVPNASACDQTFLSDIAKNGTFTSPNYGGLYPPGLHCRYEFRGVGRQRVQILFTDFNLFHPHGEPQDCEVADRVAVYVTVNGHKEKIDDYCGKGMPKELMSNGPTMTIDFFSLGNSKGGRGFSAKFAFVENFGITVGEQLITHPCLFRFNSTEKSQNGTFWSPNFPGFYPRSTECHYLFYGRPGEKVRINFAAFDVEGFPPCASNQASDYVEVSNYMTVDRKMPRYCGNQQDLVLESENQFYRVSFKANDRFDSTGFHATYRFIPVAEPISVTRRQETLNSKSSTGISWNPLISVFCLVLSVAYR